MENSFQFGKDGKFQVRRHTFQDAGQNSYTKSPSTNPDLFVSLNNVLSPSIENVLKRRWGYKLWSSLSDKFVHLYEFQRNADLARRIVGTVADATGSNSTSNIVAAMNEDGTTWNSLIFTPSALATKPYMVNSRDYGYFEDGVAADLIKWDGSSGTGNHSYVLSAAANASGGNTVYTGVTLSALLPGETVTIAGFTTAANNGVFKVVSSAAGTVTVNNPNGVAESIAATLVSTSGTSKWGIAAPTSPITLGSPTGGGAQTYTLSAAANNAGGNTVYTGVGLDLLFTNTAVTIQGFLTGANNGNFTVVSSTSTTVKVNNPAGVAETHAATLVTQNRIRPTTLLNGWGANGHVGSYEGGVNQGFTFGLDGSTTSAYSNPGNAFDSDLDTYASATIQHSHAYAGCVWSFSSQTTNSVNIQLGILSEVPASGTDGQVVSKRSGGIWYTIDGGSSWIQVYDQPNRPKQYDIIAIPDGTDFGKVQVMAFIDAHDDMYQKVYDLYLEGTTTGSGPLTLTSGRQYFVAYENSTAGNFSDVSPVSTSTGPLFGAAQPLNNIPVSSDPQVDKKVILATADGGDQTILYLVVELANSVVSYIDSMNELQLLAQNVYAFTDVSGNDFGLFDNQPPPNGKYPTKHKGRVFMIVDGKTLAFSKNAGDVITPTGVVAGRYEEDWPPFNTLDISSGAETANGLLSDGEFLYISTDRRVLRLAGDGPENFQPPSTSFAEGGVNNVETWVPVFLDGQPLGAMWLTQDFRVILSDFNSHIDIGTPLQDILDTINPAASTTSHGVYYAQGAYNFYALFIPTGVATAPNTMIVFDLKARTWVVWTLTDNADASLYNITYAGLPQMLFWSHFSPGYKFVPGLFQDRVNNTPVNYTTSIKTPFMDFGDPTLRKVLNWMQVMTADAASTITVQGASTQAEFAAPSTVVTNAALITSPFGDLRLNLAGRTTKDRFYQFTFTSTGTADIVLSGYDIRGLGFHSY